MTATAAPKVSWLKRVGQFMGKVLGIVASEAKPVADTASQFAALMFPQFAAEIGYADNLVTRIATEAVAVEGMAAAQGAASGSGPQKLAALVGNVGPAIDAWVQANFPGSKQISAARKAGLASAIVDVVNEVEPAAAAIPVFASALAPAANVVTLLNPTPSGSPSASASSAPPATSSAAPAPASVGATGDHGAVGNLGTNAPAQPS